MKSPLLLALVILAGLLTGPPLCADEDFTPLAADRTDRAVVMKLPDGVRRVRLRVRQDDGTWKTHTIAHLAGNEGALKLRLPDGVAAGDLEVSASWSDPFPHSFYQGATDHAATESSGATFANPAFGPQAMEDATTGEPEAEPVVEESDIWKWRGRTLYFFNQYRGLQVIDVSDPSAPGRLASLRVDSYGEQMYLHPDKDAVILLTQDSATGSGEVVLVGHEATHTLQQRASIPVPGFIIESRLVGNILYVVSRHTWQEDTTSPDGILHVAWRSGLTVTKADLTDPADPLVSPPLHLGSERFNYWGAQVQATARALLVSTNAYDPVRRQSTSTVHVIDISDPHREPAVTHHLPIAGQVLNKFNLHLDGDHLTAVSQVWRGGTIRERFASVETFDLARSQPKLAAIEFANNESITATRFVGDLLYVVTFLRIDPLFVIDLADPARPRLLSELEVPGFSTYLQPHRSDALLSIGVEGSRIAVSWFDVSDPTAPALASRAFIGASDGWSWTEANWDEKAFGYFPDDDLLLVPYQGSVPGTGWISGVQLVELRDREVVLRGSFAHEFRARRARVLGEAVVSISGRSLKALDISDRDQPRLLAELPLAWPADLVHRVGDHLVQLERGPSFFSPGSDPDAAHLRITPADDPDELLATLDLPGGRIAGSLLVGDCLHLAQLAVSHELVGEEILSHQVFTASVIDLGDPDRPLVTGRTTHRSSGSGFGGDYRGALLPGGALVWFPSSPSFPFWEPVPLRLDVPLRGDVIYPWFPASNRVFTVGLTDKAQPVVLAAVDLATAEETWPAGGFRLLGSTLYHGLQKSETVSDPDGTVRWVTQHLLATLDLGDPAAPVEGDLVKLPGTFAHALGTRSGGTVLFTTRRTARREADGRYHTDLEVHALAFDGMDAFLVDELVLSDHGYGPNVFHDRFLVLGSTDYASNPATTRLAHYEWSDTGAFRALQSPTRPSAIHSLAVVDDLLVARGAHLAFSDFSDPADPDPASISFPITHFGQRLEDLEIHQRAEAHLPLGYFGVRTLDFGGTFDQLAPTPGPQPAGEPPTEWKSIPLASLAGTSTTGTVYLGALAEGEDWKASAGFPLRTYDDWMRLHLALDPADPIPDPEGDLDSDGLTNRWEFFTGTDPADPRSAAPVDPTTTTADDHLDYLAIRLALNPGARLSPPVPLVSSDLQSWTIPADWVVEVDPFGFEATLRSTTPVTARPASFLQVQLGSLPTLP